MAHTSSTLIGALVTPILCRQSWHTCCYVYGSACTVLNVAWYLLAADKPTVAARPAEAINDAGATAAGVPKPNPKSKPRRRPSQWAMAPPKPSSASAEKAVEWGIFRVPAVQVSMVNMVALGSCLYSMLLMAPTYFVDKLGCTPEEAGRYIALVTSINIPGAVLIGTVESMLMKWKVPTETVRRYATTIGAMLCSASLVLFSMARTPQQGFVAYLAYQVSAFFHSAGCWPNMLELGGKDTALFASVMNSLAQIPPVLVPALGLALRRRTGSWVPQYAWPAVFHTLTGLLWLRYCSCTPAREQLEAMSAKSA